MAGQYYTSLDGLRAIAVLFVLAFHLDLPWFEGGFLGVDVFFVISGFIVTKVTMKRLSDDQVFDWKDFFLRRVKRLWPELYLTMTATVIFGAGILKHSEFQRIPLSGIAQTGLVSNFRFWIEADSYFDVGAKGKPLLHYWSLAVEEQFYMFFALMLTIWTLHKPNNSWILRLILFVLWLTSLGLSVVLASGHESLIFYLLPFRAWEFLAGVISASASVTKAFVIKSNEKKIAELLTLILFVYFIAGLLFTEQTAVISPILTQIIPVTAVSILLVILVVNEDHGTETLIGRFLSIKPLSVIGEISYSIYLWHWPIICFANSINRTIDDNSVFYGIITLTFSLALLSHHYLTAPIRNIPNDTIREHYKLALAAFAVPIIGFVALCLVTYKVDFIPEFKPNMNITIQPEDLRRWTGEGRTCTSYHCFGHPLGNCDKDRSYTNTVFVIGDSHALTLGAMYTRLQKDRHVCFHIYAQSACGPYLNGDIYPPNNRKQLSGNCKKQNRNALEDAKKLASKKKLKAIFLIGRWEQHLSYLILDRKGYGFQVSLRQKYYAAATDFHRKMFQNAISGTIELLRDLTENLVIMYQIPVMPTFNDLPSYCNLDCALNFGLKLEDVDPILTRKWLGEIGKIYPEVKFIEPKNVFCNNNLCSPHINGILAYSDFSHMNNYGAMQLQHLFEPYVDS